MTGRVFALKPADLGMKRPHCRPWASHDNPFSESQFKTLKHRPEFFIHCGSLEDARACGSSSFHWLNHEHRQSRFAC